MKKYSKEDQRRLATCAAECAEGVLPFFEEAYPKDDRPRKAIEACRTWIRTDVFKMADIRGAFLGTHTAAREAKVNDRLALPHMPPVRRWRHMFHNTPSALFTMLLKASQRLILTMPK